MLPDDWWKIEMHRGTELAYLFGTIPYQEKNRLDKSVERRIDENQMNKDTWRRLNRKK